MVIIKEILFYSNFLNKSFGDIYNLCLKIEKENIFLSDKIENGYLQFIWEMMVESIVCLENDFIEPYGDGADLYELSSRVVYPEKFANKTIKVFVKKEVDLLSNKIIINKDFDFIKLVSFDGINYNQNIPFNFVLCDDKYGEKYLFNINIVQFILKDLKSDCVDIP